MVDRRLSIMVLSALLLGGAILASDNLTPLPRVHGANVSISLVGTLSGWNSSTTPNPKITVNQGDVVTISLSSLDTTHQFALDVDKDGAKFTGSCSSGDTCSGLFAPGAPASVMISVNFAPGTYTYFCTFHSTMVGSFVVNSSTVGGTALTPDIWSLIGPYLGLAVALVAVVATAAYVRRNHRKQAK